MPKKDRRLKGALKSTLPLAVRFHFTDDALFQMWRHGLSTPLICMDTQIEALSLLVDPNGNKDFYLYIEDKAECKHLGPFPTLSLAAARQEAQHYLKDLPQSHTFEKLFNIYFENSY